jgi:hypothetical protein
VNLAELASIGEIVSSIAVIISLVYLAMQIRQNTEAERTSTYQSIVSDFGALNNNMASTPELSDMFVRGLENFEQFNPDERARISQSFFQCFRYFENMFYQHHKGYLDEDIWVGWKRLILTYYSRPGFQTWWEFRKDVYSRPFVDFLATEQLDIPIPSYYDLSNTGPKQSGTSQLGD